LTCRSTEMSTLSGFENATDARRNLQLIEAIS